MATPQPAGGARVAPRTHTVAFRGKEAGVASLSDVPCDAVLRNQSGRRRFVVVVCVMVRVSVFDWFLLWKVYN